MRTASEFFAMGGYAGYVWGSVLVTFVLLALEVGLVRLRAHALKQRLTALRGAHEK
jgi:heme exporter protein D